MRNRNEIPKELLWDLSHIFASREAWDKAYAECNAMIPSLAAHKGTLVSSAKALFETFEDVYTVEEKFAHVAEYAFLMLAQNGGDTEAQTMCSMAETLEVKFSSTIAYIEPELMSIPEDVLDGFMSYAPLKKYAHIIKNATRLREHILDEAGEEMLAKIGKITGTPSDTFNMFSNVELKFPPIKNENGEEAEMSHGSFMAYRESKNKEVRDAAFKAMFGTYGKYINTLACLYNGNVKKDNAIAEIQKYKSARESVLAGSNVPVTIYDALIEAVHESIPLMSKYLKLRAKVLGVEKVDVFDLYTPMVADVEYQMPYEKACDLVIKAVAPLGKEYQDVIRRAYNENWIDVYETPGKEAGAFSAGVYGVHPYVKLNYTDTLDDAFTLAHELGHSMHSYLSSEKQDYANHDYHLIVAEVASTCNEVLLTKYLLSVEKDKKIRAYILNHFLEGFRTTVFRQTLFAEFELKAHELEASGTPLTADSLCELYASLEKTYYPEAAFREEIKYEWSYIPHFYRAFYVYQYATGFSSAVAIATEILETGDPSKYLEFLSMGGSDYPINELKVAGVDLNSPSVVKNALKVFDETIDKLDEIIG